MALAQATQVQVNPREMSRKLARLIEIKEQLKPLEEEAEILKNQIKMAVENGAQVTWGDFYANVHDSTKYSWNPTKFRAAYPGLWIECAVIDAAKANAFMKAGRITWEKAEEIRTPIVSKVLTIKEQKQSKK